MNRIIELHDEFGQSIWLDSLSRSYFSGGLIDELLALGVRGLTSNPTLLANAIRDDAAYEPAIRELASRDLTPEEMYWALVDADVSAAAQAFLPLYLASAGADGFVSVEVSPDLAFDPHGTVAAARELWERYASPNILIKIPATVEGLVAIEETIAAGISVNVTLIFSPERYERVLDAYERGLQRLIASGGDASKVASVASFFVSRVDTEIDGRLQSLAEHAPDRAEEALALRGRAAVAQARLADEIFRARIAAPTFQQLERSGANVQRLLWASTSSKNPAYPPLIYVDNLIGPRTVNTMPESTIRAFERAGKLQRTVDQDYGAAHEVFQRLAALGIDAHEVADILEQRAVAAFQESFDVVRSQLATRVVEVARG